MLQDRQNYKTMTTKTKIDLLQELGSMNFFGKGQVTDLIDTEADCTHPVCSHLMISSLQHLDERAQVDARDYQYDPNTGSVQRTCPKCGFYLRDYIIHLWKSPTSSQPSRGFSAPHAL